MGIAIALFGAVTHPNPVAGGDRSAPQAGVGGAFGSFTVAPTRLVLEMPGHSGELTLVNTGHEKATYRLTLVDMQMDENGALREADSTASPEPFADGLIRYSPHQVELEPGIPQTIRLLVEHADPLPPGEYRSHLLIRAIPPTFESDSGGARDFSVALTPVYGIAVPVIVRHGSTAASAAIQNLRLLPADGAPARVAFDVMRSGNRSVYGSVHVELVRQGRRPLEVGLLRGVAVYVPNLRRRVEVPVHLGTDADLRDVKLQVRYEDGESARGMIAEAELDLP